MKQFFIFLLFILSVNISAQEISISSFEQRPNDLDARVNFSEKDQNGDICALLKIATAETDFVFEGGQLGIMKTEEKTGDYWVYIPYSSKRIIIKHDETSWSFDVNEKFGSFTNSRDGKTYKTVKIGNQIWMAENLNYNTSSGSWCYDNSTTNCNKYGRLYNWETAKTVCPSGWELPSKSDFETLLSNVGGSGSNAYNALISGGNSGFSALFGGWRYDNGSFNYIVEHGYFWSSSLNDDDYAWNLSISCISKDANMYYGSRSVGFSVRCLQD